MKTITSSDMPNSKAKLSPILTLALLLCLSTLAQAAPVGGIVTSGGATISSAGSNTTINQSTSKAIINWQGFNVGASESVRFNQPSSSAIVLNRVVGPDGSSIMGNISANGRVFLINPNGILFGSGSQVNVGGMVASTLGMTDANFLAGNYQFTGNSAAAILNQGTLNTNTDGGYIALLGANVSNTGVITARLGTVALAAGNGITLDVAGDNLLNVSVNEGAVNALVSNGHLIMADGGQVLMTARGASSLLSNAVNNTGLIQAQSIESANGLIILSAGPDAGVVNVSGTIDASGLGSGQTGGTVELLGGTVNLSNASIDVSGNTGGGQAIVGGNFNGAGPQPNSLYTNIDSTSTINADATESGNGGKIAVWSDNTTVMDGTLTARGGALSGDGGFIETSGKKVVLADTAYVNTLAPNGETGTWLLDPINWSIGGTYIVGEGESSASLVSRLGISDVTITATNDINVNTAVTWTNANDLTLEAGHDVNIKAAITASTAGAILNITAGNDILITDAITASGAANQINMTAGNDVHIEGALTSDGAANEINVLARRGSIRPRATYLPGTLTSSGSTANKISMIAGVDIEIGTVTTTGSAEIIAGNSGTGAGTVKIDTRLTAPNTILRFNPASYATTSTEIDGYTAKITSTTKDIKAWVFLQGNDKTYDQSTAATLSLKAPPAGITLTAGTAIFGNKNAGVDKAVTYSGYSIGGATTDYALYSTSTTSGAGTTTATIAPASLVVSATGTNKVFDGTTTDVVTLSATPLSGDSVLPGTYTSANFANTAVGVNEPVSVVGIALTGADASNYSYNTTASTTASITPSSTPNPASNVNGLEIVPVVPQSGSSQAPIALQEDMRNGVSTLAIVPFVGTGIAAGSLLATQASNQSNLLTVADPQKGAELQSLFPAPVIAPYRAPKQGRN